MVKANEPLGPTSIDLANKLVAEPYAWPGGYPLYAHMFDGGALCKVCCKDEAERIADVDPHCPDDQQWRIHSLTVNWEDTELTCSHCDKPIESAYGGDDEDQTD